MFYLDRRDHSPIRHDNARSQAKPKKRKDVSLEEGFQKLTLEGPRPRRSERIAGRPPGSSGHRSSVEKSVPNEEALPPHHPQYGE